MKLKFDDFLLSISFRQNSGGSLPTFLSKYFVPVWVAFLHVRKNAINVVFELISPEQRPITFPSRTQLSHYLRQTGTGEVLAETYQIPDCQRSPSTLPFGHGTISSDVICREASVGPVLSFDPEIYGEVFYNIDPCQVLPRRNQFAFCIFFFLKY